MRQLCRRVVWGACLTGCAVVAAGQQGTGPVGLLRYVDPNIGGIGRLLQAAPPFIQRPHGITRVVPLVTPGLTDRYLSTEFYGMAVGPIAVMPVGRGSTDGGRGVYSELDHDHEVLRPDYYALESNDSGVRTELTTTAKAVATRFRFRAREDRRVLLLLPAAGQVTAAEDQTVQLTVPLGVGESEASRHEQKATAYLSVKFLQPLARKLEVERDCKRGLTALGPNPNARDQVCSLDFGEIEGTVEVRVGLSYISVGQAQRNVTEEMGERSFAELCRESAEAWERALGAIRVEGGNEAQRRIFYTALYRSQMRLTDITEDGRYFSAYDGKVHEAGKHDFYVCDGLWDTYRSMHPLQMLIEPRIEQDVLNSYVRMYQQSGWMPSFPQVTGENAAMVGEHAAILMADAYNKGLRDFDLEIAYQGLKKTALEGTMLPWRRGPATALDRFYQQKGYYAALNPGEQETVAEVHPFERRQASSVTEAASYDAWCISVLAQALGHTEDAARFRARALDYRKLFDARIGFISARTADGEWVKGFDPKTAGGQGGRDYYTEVNAWIATFDVQHDVRGLMELMGGREAFAKKLDALFNETPDTSKRAFLNQFPDMTGLVGMYSQGNEPAFHIPYLYLFAGEPWKTQFRIRQLLDTQFSDLPDGVPGDEDGGAESSWYVFSALGFYPVCPGQPVYAIGSPLFTKTEMSVGAGQRFTVIAKDASGVNKYIGSAMLNGKPLERAWLTHEEITSGGTLVLQMEAMPNRQWGSRPEDAPPVGAGAED